MECQLLSSQSEQFEKLQKALIGWKKAGLPKQPLFCACKQSQQTINALEIPGYFDSQISAGSENSNQGPIKSEAVWM